MNIPKIDILEYPGLKSRKQSRVTFELWVCPSFSSTVVWALLQHEARYFVRRIATAPVPMGSPFGPDTYGAESEIPESLYSHITGRLKAVRVSPFDLDTSIGLDGTSYGIRMEAFMSSTNLSWWCTPQKGLTELYLWFFDTIKEFQALLPPSEHIREI